MEELVKDTGCSLRRPMVKTYGRPHGSDEACLAAVPATGQPVGDGLFDLLAMHVRWRRHTCQNGFLPGRIRLASVMAEHSSEEHFDLVLRERQGFGSSQQIGKGLKEAEFGQDMVEQ